MTERCYGYIKFYKPFEGLTTIAIFDREGNDLGLVNIPEFWYTKEDRGYLREGAYIEGDLDNNMVSNVVLCYDLYTQEMIKKAIQEGYERHKKIKWE